MARVSLGVIGKYDHITPVLKKLEFLRVEHKVLNDICILVYKISKHQLPEWLFDLSTVNELRGTATRQWWLLYSKDHTEIGLRTITVKDSIVWNMIPALIKDTGSLSFFKDKLKKYDLVRQRWNLCISV